MSYLYSQCIMLHENTCGIGVLHCIVYFCNNNDYICIYMYLLYASKEVLILRIKLVIVNVMYNGLTESSTVPGIAAL